MSLFTAGILIIGDEILSGRTQDTNANFIAKKLTSSGIKLEEIRVIQDKKSESKPRYSIPFFLHPAPSINLKSIYRNDDIGILADDFLNQRLKEIKLY